MDAASLVAPGFRSSRRGPMVTVRPRLKPRTPSQGNGAFFVASAADWASNAAGYMARWPGLRRLVRSVGAVGKKDEDAKQYEIGRLRFTFDPRGDFVNANVQNGRQSLLVPASFYGPLHQVAL